MKKHLNKILGVACIVFATHSAHTLYVVGCSLAQWDGTICLYIVGVELLLIRYHIHKNR